MVNPEDTPTHLFLNAVCRKFRPFMFFPSTSLLQHILLVTLDDCFVRFFPQSLLFLHFRPLYWVGPVGVLIRLSRQIFFKGRNSAWVGIKILSLLLDIEKKMVFDSTINVKGNFSKQGMHLIEKPKWRFKSETALSVQQNMQCNVHQKCVSCMLELFGLTVTTGLPK